jgi:hypothetical protein
LGRKLRRATYRSVRGTSSLHLRPTVPRLERIVNSIGAMGHK